MFINVTSIHIPAWSTIGYGEGTDEEGNKVCFVGDHRPMQHLGEQLREADEPPQAWIEPHQLVAELEWDDD